MKIAFVHNQCLPYRHFLFSALARTFDIDFFLFNQNKEDVPEDCNVTILRGYKIPKCSDYWIVPKLRSELNKKKYDLIVGGDLGAYNTAVAYRAALKNGVPFAAWILEWDWVAHPRRRFRQRFEDKMLDYASKLIVPGNNHRNYLLSRGVAAGKLCYVPNCLEEFSRDYDQSHPLAIKLTQIKENKNRNIVCSLGRHIPIKGHDRAIRAQEMLEREMADRAPFLVIAGDGGLLGKNRQLAKSLKIKNILFLDRYIGRTEKTILYSLMDLLVLPSKRTRAFEAWGLVCNEALYFGKPIIVSDAVGCANEIVRHKLNGFIYPNASNEELARRIKALTINRRVREKFGEASKEIYNSYRPHVMVNSFIHLINQMAAVCSS